MKRSRLFFIFTSVFIVAAAIAQENPITIRAGTLLDGKGGVQHDVQIVVQNGKILQIGRAHV